VTKNMSIPTEPIGSIPRSVALLEAMTALAAGRITEEQLHSAEEKALRDTIARFEETDFPVISDGEQTKPSFAMYPLAGLQNLGSRRGSDSVFVDGHMRRLPRLTAGRFGYGVHAAHCDGRIRRQHASAVFLRFLSLRSLECRCAACWVSWSSRC
jgi:5-methyltetrahydropteroyltriglutamate--homocysteine methyltransferase